MKKKINHLVVGGEKTLAGQWPWLVAIYIARRKMDLQCAGTLVTNTHVITAANCLHWNNQILPAGAFLVSVGRYRLHDWKERWAENIELSAHRIHPDYQVQRDNMSPASADSDLSVLILKKIVKYTEMIQLICLWSGPINLENVVGQIGVVVGWGIGILRNHSRPRLRSYHRRTVCGATKGSG